MTLPASLRNASNEIMAGRPIEAIKKLRAELSLPLKDAKDLVDEARHIIQSKTNQQDILVVDAALEEALKRYGNGELTPRPVVTAAASSDSLASHVGVTNNLLRQVLAQLKENNELIKDWIDTQS